MRLKRRQVSWMAAATALLCLLTMGLWLLWPASPGPAAPWVAALLGAVAAGAMFVSGATSRWHTSGDREAAFQPPAGELLDDAEWARQVLIDISNALPVAVYHMENAPSGYRKFNFVSARTQAVLGVAAAEIIANPDTRWRHLLPEDLAKVRAEIEKTTREAVSRGLDVPPFDVEFRLEREGEERCAHVRAYPIRFRENHTSVWCGYYEDVTERKRIELALQTTNKELTAILDASAVGMIFVRKNRILRVNSTCAAMFNSRPEDLLDQPRSALRSRLPGVAARRHDIQPTLAAGHTFTVESELLHDGAPSLWVFVTGRAIYPQAPELGELWLLENVTQRRADHEALRLAKTQAEVAAQARSSFLANMSHEIRTPMNAIMGFTHLLGRTELSARQREHLRRIELSSQHLLGILNDILDFSKAESGMLAIEHIAFELDQVLETLYNVVAPKAHDKGLELTCELAADVPANLVGDPLRLGQILINYVNNAIKFTERGDIHLHIRRQYEEVDGIVLRFEVSDTGIGLGSDQIGRLFQNFVQADASTTRKYGGTGLGLAISKTLAELMDGCVGVQSRLGEGSTFWFTARLQADPPQPQAAVPALQGLRALVADDHPRAARLLARQLTERGLLVWTVHSGDEALGALRQAPLEATHFDLLFLDEQMPGQGGIALAAQVQREALCPAGRVVMVGTLGGDEALAGAAAAGVDDWLGKPVVGSALSQVLARLSGAGKTPPHDTLVPPSVAQAALAGLRGARVLLVDDNALNREIGTEFLNDAGMQVDCAENGLEAVQKVRAGDHDLVLMDLHMPVMDGVDAVRRIREDPRYSQLPIVAMTASAMDTDRQRCLQAGMDDHLAKPIVPEALWAALRRWIRPRPGLGSDARASDPRVPDRSTTADPAKPAVPTDWPAQLDGIDLALGLQSVAGRQSSYRRLARGFVATQATAVARLGGELALGQYAAAELRVHTLKGLAGSLGARGLAQQADGLEQRLRRGQPHGIEALLAPLDAELARVVASLHTLLPAGPAEETTADGSAAASEAEARAAAQAIHELLRMGDVDACDRLREQRPALRAALGEDFRAFADCVEDFDFESARRLLETRGLSGGQAPQS